MISRPQLPPRKGFVEVEGPDGKHIYRMTEEYRRQKEKEELLAALDQTAKDLTAQATDMQLAMTETYEANETNFTDIQLALCEIYEILGGTNNG